MAASLPVAIRKRSGPMPPFAKRIWAKRRAAITVDVMAEAPLLDVADVETSYGLSRVLFGISLTIAPGEMVSLMGRNGMGKTTTVRSIMGLTPAAAGSIRFGREEIRQLTAYRVGQRGIGVVPGG